MEDQHRTKIKKELLLFFAIVGLFGFSTGMSENVISNFFFDAYQVTAAQRGFLEIPREAPGVLAFLAIAFTYKIGDVRLAAVAMLLCAAGMLVLGLLTPSFAVMAMFIFVHSVGAHLFYPLQESIGMSIIGDQDIGKRMGQYSAVRTAFMLLASVLIFIGFRAGLFSFMTQLKLPFVIGAAGYAVTFVLFAVLFVKFKVSGEARKKEFKIIIKKRYTLFYILAVLTGVHRQIMLVYGPWVLIETLGRQADTLALLIIISSLLGAFLLPVFGRCIDRFGTKKLLLVEGFVFIALYVVFGFMSSAFANGSLAHTGLPVIIICGLIVIDRLGTNTNIVRAVYLRSIVTDPADITPTLSTGFSMDHVVSITCAFMGGVVWYRYGSQYVFYAAALLSVINVVVAVMIKPAKPSAT